MKSKLELNIRNPQEFKGIMPKLVKLASRDNARPGLQGVLFSPRFVEADGEKRPVLFCVATDGHRLARVSFALESLEMVGLPERDAKDVAISGRDLSLDPFPVLVPKHLVTETCRAIDGRKNAVPGPLFFRCDGESGEVEFQVWRSVFRGSQIASTFPAVYQTLLAEDGRDLRVGLNTRYLRDVLDLIWWATDHGHVRAEFKPAEVGIDPVASMRFVPSDSREHNVEAIVMPVRLPENSKT